MEINRTKKRSNLMDGSENKGDGKETYIHKGLGHAAAKPVENFSPLFYFPLQCNINHLFPDL